jgi:hypothetical protein
MTKEQNDLLIAIGKAIRADISDAYAIATGTPEKVRDHKQLLRDYASVDSALAALEPRPADRAAA